MSEQRCSNCEHLLLQNEQYYCEIGSKLVNISERPSWCPLFKNCHNYCYHAKRCRYAKGENGINPEDCAMYWKIEDIMNDARDILEEERRAKGEDEYD